MKVLVACEESQAVCKEFRRLGHEAYSCDIMECSGGHPEWHIQGDALRVLEPKFYQDDFLQYHNIIYFATQDGNKHHINGKWDLIIAHPPCTHLAVSGARHFEKKRADGRQHEAIEFFCRFLEADCDKIAIENPVGIISGEYIKDYFPVFAKKHGLPQKPQQIIQPYEFGDPSRKTTCLWLKGLPMLKPTNIVKPELLQYTCADGRKVSFSKDYCRTKGNRGCARSKTYPGIAKAMAEQWGGDLNVL